MSPPARQAWRWVKKVVDPRHRLRSHPYSLVRRRLPSGKREVVPSPLRLSVKKAVEPRHLLRSHPQSLVRRRLQSGKRAAVHPRSRRSLQPLMVARPLRSKCCTGTCGSIEGCSVVGPGLRDGWSFERLAEMREDLTSRGRSHAGLLPLANLSLRVSRLLAAVSSESDIATTPRARKRKLLPPCHQFGPSFSREVSCERG